MARLVWTTVCLAGMVPACASRAWSQAGTECPRFVDTVLAAIVGDSALPQGVLVGRVLSSPGDQPVTGAQILVTAQIGAMARQDGSFRLSSVPSDSITLTVRFLGYHGRLARGRMPDRFGGRVTLHLRKNPCAKVQS